mgnify:CR=1 FL=1
MVRNAIGHALLFVSLAGFGIIMGPRQTGFTATRATHQFCAILFASGAIISIWFIVVHITSAFAVGLRRST